MPSPHDEMPEELQDEQIIDLPSREALTIVDPAIFGAGLPPLLGRTPAVTPATREGAELAPPPTA
jgi:hypothetical protein